jgi:hypothetical protein
VNCATNENSVFSRADIKGLFQQYELVQLFTDVVPAKYFGPGQLEKDPGRAKAYGGINMEFQEKAFGDVQLPLYVILEPMPDGKLKMVAKYHEGLINDVTAFARFLKRPEEESSVAQLGTR